MQGKLLLSPKEQKVLNLFMYCTDILTWFSDGSPLAPVSNVTKHKPRKKPGKPFGPNYRRFYWNELEKKRRRERFLNRKYFRNTKPENLVTDKRDYYRKEYLKSEHWRKLKWSKIKSSPFCADCGSTKHLDVHHLNYRNLYDVELTDLLVLCRACHHKRHRS